MARLKKPAPGVLPPVLTCPHDNKLHALELNLNTLTSQVVNFETLLEQSGTAMDEKLDIVLAEAKDFRDLVLEELRTLRDTVTQGQKDVEKRITAAETHIEHLLRPGKGGR